MKLFTITATPVQNLDQMIRAGYDIDEHNTVAHINKLHMDEYPDEVAKILGAWNIDGFTMYKVSGYWQGVPEESFKIEIAIDSDPERVYSVAMKLKEMYHQDSVMVTLPNNTVKFV